MVLVLHTLLYGGLTHEAPIGVARNGRFDLVLAILVGLLLGRELFDVLFVLLLVFVPALEHVLELTVGQEDTLALGHLPTEVGILRHSNLLGGRRGLSALKAEEA